MRGLCNISVSTASGKDFENMTDYEKQAIDFLKETSTTFEIRYTGTRKYFPEDEKERDVYQVTLKNLKGSYSFTFGDSLINTEKNYSTKYGGIRKKPSTYNILAGLGFEPPSSVDECAETFGYTKPSVAIRVFNALVEEWKGLNNIFTPEQIEKLREIQ